MTAASASDNDEVILARTIFSLQLVSKRIPMGTKLQTTGSRSISKSVQVDGRCAR